MEIVYLTEISFSLLSNRYLNSCSAFSEVLFVASLQTRVLLFVLCLRLRCPTAFISFLFCRMHSSSQDNSSPNNSSPNASSPKVQQNSLEWLKPDLMLHMLYKQQSGGVDISMFQSGEIIYFHIFLMQNNLQVDIIWPEAIMYQVEKTLSLQWVCLQDWWQKDKYDLYIRRGKFCS